MIAIDVGGTHTRVARMKSEDDLSGKIVFETNTDPIKEVEALAEAIASLGDLPLSEKIVMGMAGALDKEGTVISSPNLPAWNGSNIADMLSKKIGRKVSVFNDAKLEALGEAIYGMGAESRIVAFLTVSTGIGGARIVDKAFDATYSGFEPGRQIIDYIRGATLEDMASGKATQREKGIAPKEVEDDAFWKEKAKIIAIGVWNVITLWSPEILALGGPMMLKKPGIDIEDVKTELEKINAGALLLPKIVISSLGDDAGLVGAYASVLHH